MAEVVVEVGMFFQHDVTLSDLFRHAPLCTCFTCSQPLFSTPHTTSIHPLALLTSPPPHTGHVDFSSEVTAALRITDGALVVVDCIEGVCVQTETVLRQALGERIKPVLTVNKIDRCFLELMQDPEEAFLSYRRVIENANVIMATYSDDALGDIQVCEFLFLLLLLCGFKRGVEGCCFRMHACAVVYVANTLLLYNITMRTTTYCIHTHPPFPPQKHTGHTRERQRVLLCRSPRLGIHHDRLCQVLRQEIWRGGEKDDGPPVGRQLFRPRHEKVDEKGHRVRDLQAWFLPICV